MRFRLKWETMASYFYLFELDSNFLILVRQDDSPDCRFYIVKWNMFISGYVWNGGMAFQLDIIPCTDDQSIVTYALQIAGISLSNYNIE